MKIRQPGASRAPSSRRAISCRSSSSSSSRRTRSRSSPALLVDQIGLAAHDQHRAPRMVLAPRREPRRDQLGGGVVERLLALADLAGAARASASPSVIPDRRALTKLATSLSAAGAGPRHRAARSGSRRCRRSPTSTASARPGVERDEIELLEAQLLLRRHHHPGAGRQPGQRRRGRRQRLLDRLVAVDLRLDRRPLARVGQRGLHDPVDEQPAARSRSAPARPTCADGSAARAPRAPASLRGSRPATG